MSACMSANVSQKLDIQSSPDIRSMSPVAVAWFCSGGITIHYVLPVLWTSRFCIMAMHTRGECGVYLKRLSRGQHGFDTATAAHWGSAQGGAGTTSAIVCSINYVTNMS